MDNAPDIRLKQLVRSLQEHIGLANQLNLDFTAQLLAMAVMEVTINIHEISHREIDALCERVEQRASCDGKHPVVLVSGPRSHDRRARTRRSRMC
jgi:hypothetical protein